MLLDLLDWPLSCTSTSAEQVQWYSDRLLLLSRLLSDARKLPKSTSRAGSGCKRKGYTVAHLIGSSRAAEGL